MRRIVAANPSTALLGEPLGGSGPRVARLFHRLLALTYFIAFASLAAQIKVLAGAKGLLPAAPWLSALATRTDIPFTRVPTLFRFIEPSDANLVAGLWLGMVLALVALLTPWPRLIWPLLVPLYLSYVTICDTFLSFQWDNLLLECGLLAIFLPRRRPARWIHLLFLLLLTKLYLQSGIAKFQSPIKDWHDGSAMTFYYQTAPIPTALAWYAHHLPEWWHHLESRAVLVGELLLPLLFFLGRGPRLVALVLFTGFQCVNLATANYGFFVYLALALHVFLLDDAWLNAARERFADLIAPYPPLDALATRLWNPERPRPPPRPIPLRLLVASAALLFSGIYVSVSIADTVQRFFPNEPAEASAPVRAAHGFGVALNELVDPHRKHIRYLRVVNTYHLFKSITRRRPEPEFQTFDGTEWTTHHLRFKPGPPDRPPPFVAPHQPRVDFRLWFYGLGYKRSRTPKYVTRLVEQMCRDPASVLSLFPEPLPAAPVGIRIVIKEYRFTTPEERRASGNWWVAREEWRSAVTRCVTAP